MHGFCFGPFVTWSHGPAVLATISVRCTELPAPAASSAGAGPVTGSPQRRSLGTWLGTRPQLCRSPLSWRLLPHLLDKPGSAEEFPLELKCERDTPARERVGSADGDGEAALSLEPLLFCTLWAGCVFHSHCDAARRMTAQRERRRGWLSSCSLSMSDPVCQVTRWPGSPLTAKGRLPAVRPHASSQMRRHPPCPCLLHAMHIFEKGAASASLAQGCFCRPGLSACTHTHIHERGSLVEMVPLSRAALRLLSSCQKDKLL